MVPAWSYELVGYLLVPAWSSSATSTSSGTNCFALLPPTYKGLSFLNDSVFQRRTGDIWAGSAKHNSNLLVPAWSSSATSTSSGTNCFALLPPTYKGLSFLNDSVFQRRTGDIWAGSAKHNSNLLVPAWSSSATSTSSGTNCFALLPPTYKGLSFLNDSVFQRRTGDIWAGSAKHNSNLLVPAWSSSATSTSSGTNCFALLPPTAEFGNQPVYIIIANILG